jgi:DNA invertase Pin-like site-specific DNA recombinase
MKTILSILSMIVTAILWITLPIVIVILALGYATESQKEKIRRLHREGKSQRAIAKEMGITRYRVRKALA